ncbi:hypothetical protein ABH935_000657 [Catenulispora sp. GAS73]|uniref:hypothetical protein n=1 Tax=Catenulispora sp. GAS73 TaxID=3156269 RepID=UPI003515A842
MSRSRESTSACGTTFAGSAPAIAAASVGMAEQAQAQAVATFCGGRPAASPLTPVNAAPGAVMSKDFQESTDSWLRLGRDAVVDGLRRRAVGVEVLHREDVLLRRRGEQAELGAALRVGVAESGATPLRV